MTHDELEKAFVAHIKYHHNGVIFAVEEETEPPCKHPRSFFSHGCNQCPDCGHKWGGPNEARLRKEGFVEMAPGIWGPPKQSTYAIHTPKGETIACPEDVMQAYTELAAERDNLLHELQEVRISRDRFREEVSMERAKAENWRIMHSSLSTRVDCAIREVQKIMEARK